MKIFIEQLKTKLCLFNLSSCSINKLISIIYVDVKYLFFFSFFLKYHTGTRFNLLIDILAVDYPLRQNRFELVFSFLSVSFNSRLFVKCVLDEFTVVPSLVSIYKVADWYEREVWDLFGIYFSNHPNLWRLLTDYGFEGHPLRKEFPLTGFFELRFDEVEKRIVSENVELSHEYKVFTFSNPWPSGFKIVL